MSIAFAPGRSLIAAPALRRRVRSAGPAVTEPAIGRSSAVPRSAGLGDWTAALGHRIDELGLDAVAGELDELVAMARSRGVGAVAAGVLADPAQPEPARCRAFAHVVSALLALPPAT